MRVLACAALGAALAGCASTSSTSGANYQSEDFNSTDTHTRTFVATESQTCEAARRALLSQGYLVAAGDAAFVSGKKAFQPDPEVHLEIDFRVVCAKDSGGARSPDGKPRTIAFVSALQDRYSLKKVNNSASVGVGVIGSVSLPYSSTDDSMVKVASQTVTDDRFYDRFFKIVERYLVLDTPAPLPPTAMPVAPQVFPEQVAPGATPLHGETAGLAMVAPLAPLPPLPAADAPQQAAADAPQPADATQPAEQPLKAAAAPPTRSVAGTVQAPAAPN
ncbi:DUF2242 domain-containing protein [Variovorax sp.]|uniref:DUF2242 domain-containing protein n=1 Tax=Variovorax sp. TaxID=1871043 RepID=UPI002D73617E|nr:DUF2242 domain-containing protein [Variovorax sp.]HYP81841.1 DUF2242 domain-containing protein [Variovorax sp.]